MITPREKEAWRLVSLGMDNAEIASEMGIIASSVHHVLTNLYDKLDVPGSGPAKRVKLALMYLQETVTWVTIKL